MLSGQSLAHNTTTSPDEPVCELQEERSLAVTRVWKETGRGESEGSGILGWCLNAIEWCRITVANDEIQG